MGDERYAGIDLLRVAAGIVLLIAHSAFWLAPLGWPYAIWQALAYFGVEVFLVTLGFLVALRWLGDRAEPLRHGIVRRAVRLWPLYALAVLVNLLFVGMLKIPAPNLATYLTFTQNLAWPHPEFFPEAWIVSAALAGSLVVAAAGWGLRRCKSSTAAVALVVSMIALAHVPRIIATFSGDPVWDLGVRKVLTMRLDIALYGVLLAVLWRSGIVDRRVVCTMLALIGIGLLIIAAAGFAPPGVEHGVFARTGLFTITDLGFALLLPWLCRLQVSAAVSRWAAIFASAAYAGLLSHMTLLRAAYALGLPTTADVAWQGLVLQLAYLCIAVATALLLWRWLDRPLRGWFRNAPTQHAPPVTKR